MATHSSILAWEIPWTEEPGGLQSMLSQRVRHNLATKQHHHDVIVQRTLRLNNGRREGFLKRGCLVYYITAVNITLKAWLSHRFGIITEKK